MSAKSKQIVDAKYCVKCGLELEQKIVEISHYDQETGQPYYSGSLTCPKYNVSFMDRLFLSDNGNGHSHISALFYNGMRCSF